MKRCFVLFLTLSILLSLSACSSASSSERADRKKDSAVESPVSAQDYYRYINEELLIADSETADGRLASLETLKIWFNHPGANTPYDISSANGTGLLSAVVEDFDSDGCLELLVISVLGTNLDHTRWRYSRYDPGASYSHDIDDSVLLLSADLYDYEDDSIYLRTTENLNFMLKNHWGSLYVAIEKIEDTYYLFSGCESENMSTYGICPYVVTRLSEAGMGMVYCSPLNFGKINPGNTNDRCDIDDPLNVGMYSFSQIQTKCESAESAQESLEERLLCYISLDHRDYGSDDLYYTAYDFTNLRPYLENNGKSWKKIDLPEGYYLEEPECSEYLADVAEEIEKSAGVKFSNISTSEGSDTFHMQCMTSDSTFLSITYNVDCEKITYWTVYNKTETDSWYAVKDAVLRNSAVDLSDEQIAPFLDHNANFLEYMNGVTVGDYTIRIFQVQDTHFSIGLNGYE